MSAVPARPAVEPIELVAQSHKLVIARRLALPLLFVVAAAYHAAIAEQSDFRSRVSVPRPRAASDAVQVQSA